jgi:hypothetical protein
MLFSEDPREELINTWLHVIYVFSLFFLDIGGTENPVNIWLIDITTPRDLPVGDGHDKYHFDSSSGLALNRDIIVSKRDEMIRLLIHELAHYYKITHDETFDDSAQIYFKNGRDGVLTNLIDKLPKQFKNNNYFESTTETLAIVLLYIYVSKFKNINGKPTNIVDMITTEILFDLAQIAKLSSIFENGKMDKHLLKTQYYSYVYLRIIHLLTLPQFIPMVLSRAVRGYIPGFNDYRLSIINKGLDFFKTVKMGEGLRFSLIDIVLVKKEVDYF